MYISVFIGKFEPFNDYVYRMDTLGKLLNTQFHKCYILKSTLLC